MKRESKNIRINKMFKTKINIDNSSHGKMEKYSFVKKITHLWVYPRSHWIRKIRRNENQF